MASLTPQPYKGARDFYPEDKRLQNYIFDTWKRVVERYGYEEYGAPLLEPYEIYAAKTGQEIVNEQTYTFTDRGGRNVVIRPEMTPSISRMVAGQRQELSYPARLYSIANFLRYERPQKGREREFWQLNADIFGVEGVEADAEIITLASEIMKAFGAKDSMYKIRINSRKLINVMMADYLELDVMQAQLMIKLFDRKDKISHEEFRDQAAEVFDEDQAKKGLQKIAHLLSAKTMGELPESLLGTDAVKEVRDLFTLLREQGITNAVFDISLMRGFDYYTGIVFEVFDTHPDNNRAMFGGGRYDGLVGLFGVEPIATVGFAPGQTMTEEFLKSHDLIPKLRSTTDIWMIVLHPDALPGAQKLATALRKEKVTVAVDISGRKLDKQMKAAIKSGVPYMLFVGENELRDEVYSLKEIATEKEQKLSFERVVTTVIDHRHKRRSTL